MRAVAFLAFFLSGASSLIFQSIWSRMLGRVFGATSVAVSTVVTAFMAGLGIGAYLIGKRVDRIKHPIVTYAVAELGVGAFGLAVPWLVSPEGWLAFVNGWLRSSFGAESIAFMLARFACVLPVLLVPTTLMGSTLPLLSRHFVALEQRAGVASSRVGALYAINTFGAVAGVFLAGFVLMPTVGVSLTNVVACSMNFGLAALIYLFRRRLLADTWRPGERLQLWASRTGRASGGTASDGPTPADTGTDPVATTEVAAATVDVRVPITHAARVAALVAFGVSGAASLCYEVVWTRALAMTIGSSVYSFSIILDTFLVGIAGGSAIAAAVLSRGQKTFPVFAVAAIVLSALACAPWAVAGDMPTYFVLLGVAAVPIAVAWAIVVLRHRSSSEELAPREGVAARLVVLAVPLALALFQLTQLEEQRVVTRLIAAVIACLVGIAAILVLFRRYPAFQLALVQLFVALATFVNYVFQDEIPCAFAKLVSTVRDLPEHVGTVQAFMFLATALSTLPATVGMGAMFPLTLRMFSRGGARVGRDVGVVYACNTIGSIVGAWLPGFVLMPWIGIERTLLVGMGLNLALGLALLVTSAGDERPTSPADPPRVGEGNAPAKRGTRRGDDDIAAAAPRLTTPLWNTVAIYVLAPLVPALVAILYFVAWAPEPGSGLRWDRSRMTLGVFRVSLAESACDPIGGAYDLEYYKDGLSTTVTVERWGSHIALKNNGKVDASNGDDMPTQIMVAGFPLLMHTAGPRDLDVAIVGMGSGVTVGSTLAFPVASVDVVELERSIVEASKFFREVNHLPYELDAFPYVRHDRLRVFNDDGRNFLASTSKKYDVIVSEPSNPWITGVSDLFTTDHFRITKRRLAEDGVYCQWVQLYEMSPENIKSIYRTFASQFRHVVVFAAEDWSSDTVLVGSDSPLTFDLARLRRSFAAPGVAPELERALVHGPYDVLARVLFANRDEVLAYARVEHRKTDGRFVAHPESSNGADDACEPGHCYRMPAPLNTDDNARIEFAAPRDLIGFERYQDYLTTLYASSWPWGRLPGHVEGVSAGAAGARELAEVASSLIAHGRKAEAASFLLASLEKSPTSEARRGYEVLTLFVEAEREPAVEPDPPKPSPHLDRASLRDLDEGYAAVQSALRQRAFAAALAAMESVPAPLRQHSGAGFRFLHGYLLYKSALAGNPSRFQEAIDTFEDILADDPTYARAHPELHYFLARASDLDLRFDQALRHMEAYVDAVRAAAALEVAGADG